MEAALTRAARVGVVERRASATEGDHLAVPSGIPVGVVEVLVLHPERRPCAPALRVSRRGRSRRSRPPSPPSHLWRTHPPATIPAARARQQRATYPVACIAAWLGQTRRMMPRSRTCLRVDLPSPGHPGLGACRIIHLRFSRHPRGELHSPKEAQHGIHSLDPCSHPRGHLRHRRDSCVPRSCWGIVLIIVGLLVGPGGVSVFS